LRRLRNFPRRAYPQVRLPRRGQGFQVFAKQTIGERAEGDGAAPIRVDEGSISVRSR